MGGSIREKIQALELEKRAFINGQFVSAIGGETFQKMSPLDGREITGITACQSVDIDLAVKAANQAFAGKIWVDKSRSEKKEIVFRLVELMKEHREELALIDTFETGRSFKNYYYDSIPKAIECLQWFCEAVDKYYDYAIPTRPNAFATVTKEPLGVVGLITPWNDPLVVDVWKLAPALLMGNSVILKPAEESTLSILRVVGLASEAGVPSGVINVVPGLGEVAGEALALHPNVHGIFFTGSSEVGKKILQYSGLSNMKKVGLECGGKSPFIVSRNCKDLQRAASVLCKNIFYNQGQICSAPSRVIVDEQVKPQLLSHLNQELKKYIPGDPSDPENEVGCVVSLKQKKRIEGFIQTGLSSGAIIVNEVDNNKIPECSVFPVIFDRVDPESVIAQEEIFGPVLAVIAVSNIKEAIQIANNSKYGLAASIWTNDLDEAHQVARELQAGIVHINCYGDDDNSAPFGGIKQSGIGKDKSMQAFSEYSYTKCTWAHLDPIP
jgi:acyl-CoA reductase-like NAD-dependent aldehyde dehydrogenase